MAAQALLLINSVNDGSGVRRASAVSTTCSTSCLNSSQVRSLSFVVPAKCGMTTSSVVPSGKCHLVRRMEIRANTQRRLQLALVCIVGSLDGRYLLSAFYRYACVGSSSGDNRVRYVQPSGHKMMVGSLGIHDGRLPIA
jgi:hypothetical protein